MRRIYPRTLAALAVASILLAACGGSSVVTPTTEANPPSTVAVTTTAPTTRPTTTTRLPATTTRLPTTTTTIPAANGQIEGPETGRLPTLPGATTSVVLPNPSTTAGQSQFITQVFNDIQTTWSGAFAQAGIRYTPARLVLFSSGVETGCGAQTADVGPFYCPADATVYLDLRFFNDLQQKLGVTGDFSQAYVIAHEMGHHIQNLLGVSQRVAAADQTNPAGANALSVRVELQADCLAGVWTHTTYTRNLLQPGDLDAALNAAAAVGDDFLQQFTNNPTEPDNWTHGSSAQRQEWLTTGYQTGDPTSCDTFTAANA